LIRPSHIFNIGVRYSSRSTASRDDAPHLEALVVGVPTFLETLVPRDFCCVKLNLAIEGMLIVRIDVEVHIFVMLCV